MFQKPVTKQWLVNRDFHNFIQLSLPKIQGFFLWAKDKCYPGLIETSSSSTACAIAKSGANFIHIWLWECSGMGQQLWLMTSHDPEDYSFSIYFNSSNCPLFVHEQRFSRRSTTPPCLHGQGRRQSELCLPWEWPTKITKDTKDQFMILYGGWSSCHPPPN